MIISVNCMLTRFFKLRSVLDQVRLSMYKDHLVNISVEVVASEASSLVVQWVGGWGGLTDDKYCRYLLPAPEEVAGYQ